MVSVQVIKVAASFFIHKLIHMKQELILLLSLKMNVNLQKMLTRLLHSQKIANEQVPFICVVEYYTICCPLSIFSMLRIY